MPNNPFDQFEPERVQDIQTRLQNLASSGHLTDPRDVKAVQELVTAANQSWTNRQYPQRAIAAKAPLPQSEAPLQPVTTTSKQYSVPAIPSQRVLTGQMADATSLSPKLADDFVQGRQIMVQAAIQAGANALSAPVGTTFERPISGPMGRYGGGDTRKVGETSAGVLRGIGGFVGGTVADPLTYAAGALGGGLTQAGLRPLATAGFTAQMGYGTADSAKTMAETWDQTNRVQKAEQATGLALSTLFTTLSAGDMIHEGATSVLDKVGQLEATKRATEFAAKPNPVHEAAQKVIGTKPNIEPLPAIKFTANNLVNKIDPETGIDYEKDWAEFPQHSVEAFDSSGKRIGHIQLLDTGSPTGKAVQVMESSLDSEYRGRGFGRRMYQEAITGAQKLGYSYLESDTNPSADAIKVWKRLGATVQHDGGDFRFSLPLTKGMVVPETLAADRAAQQEAGKPDVSNPAALSAWLQKAQGIKETKVSPPSNRGLQDQISEVETEILKTYPPGTLMSIQHQATGLSDATYLAKLNEFVRLGKQGPAARALPGQDLPDTSKMSNEERHDWLNKNVNIAAASIDEARQRASELNSSRLRATPVQYLDKNGKLAYGIRTEPIEPAQASTSAKEPTSPNQGSQTTGTENAAQPNAALGKFQQLLRDIRAGVVYHGTTAEAAADIQASGLQGMSINNIVRNVAKRTNSDLSSLSVDQKERLGSLARSYNMQLGTTSFTHSQEVASRWAGKGGEIAAQVEAILRNSPEHQVYGAAGKPTIVTGYLTEAGRALPSYKHLLHDAALWEEDVQKGEYTPEQAYRHFAETYYDLRVKNEHVTLEPPKIGPGPGAKTAGTPSEAGRPAQVLAEVAGRIEPGQKPSLAQRASEAVASRIQTAHDWVSNALPFLTENAAKIANKIVNPGYFPADWEGFKNVLGQWHYDLTQAAIDRTAMIKQVMKVVPDAARRRAMSHYIQADGDEGKLAYWSQQAEGHPAQPDYELARHLTDEEKHLATNIRNYMDARLDQAQQIGMLDQGLENYFPQMWKARDFAKAQQNMSAAMSYNKLRTNPGFIKQRFYDNMFEGEVVNGLKPISKDFAFLLGAYDKAFTQATAARNFIHSLTQAEAGDGRPIAAYAGAGATIKTDKLTQHGEVVEVPTKHVIFPDRHNWIKRKGEGDIRDALIAQGYDPEEAASMAKSRSLVPIRDYKGGMDKGYEGLNDRNLKGWTFAIRDPESGLPGLVKGDLVVHPDYAKFLSKVLEPSRVGAVGKAVLKGSAVAKQTLLSAAPLPSLFHQTQLAQHLVEHWVNPLRLEELNLDHPDQATLVKNGLVLYDDDNIKQQTEGVMGGGLASVIPGVGEMLGKYNNYLFRETIPRYKMSMAMEALKRNRERYGNKYSDSQIAQLTAKQANAAFGGLNYKFMGRSRTTQDAMRLMFLAPDFLEARARFLGQTLTPGGAEQRMAAGMRGALAQYMIARVVNKLVDDDYHFDRPFSVIYHGKEYTTRSVHGDAWHLYNDPRGFVYHRLNPQIARTAIEAITGVDEYGRPKDAVGQAQDFFRSFAPIPYQGIISPRSGETRMESLGESALASMGLERFRYMTAAEQLAFKQGNNFAKLMTSDERTKYNHLMDLSNQMRNGELKPDDVIKEYQTGRLSPNDLDKLDDMAASSPLARHVKMAADPDKALQVWKVASDKERQELKPIMLNKGDTISDKYGNSPKAKELQREYDKILDWQPKAK